MNRQELQVGVGMSDSKRHDLTAAEVLQRYKEEDLPAFSGMDLTNVNQVGLFGERPLDVAAVRGDIEEMLALLRGGAEVNAPGELGYTALHEAVSQGNIAAIKVLLEFGADANARNKFGETPLEIARTRSREDLVALLKG